MLICYIYIALSYLQYPRHIKLFHMSLPLPRFFMPVTLHLLRTANFRDLQITFVLFIFNSVKSSVYHVPKKQVHLLHTLLNWIILKTWWSCLLILKCLIWCFFPPLYSQNLEIKTDTAKSLADSLDRADSPTFPYLNTLLRILATRCMMQAVYFCSGMDNDFHHYGLASPIYTHFTSPIRRYFFLVKLKEIQNS